MGYRLEQVEPGIVGVSFFGRSTIGERLDALEEVNALHDSNDGVGALIDMSEADMRVYSAAHALEFSHALARRRPSKVAYVLRPNQADMVATTMSGLHGPQLFRRFATRETALAWLRETEELYGPPASSS